MLQPITSRDNDKIKQACRLRDSEAARAAAGLFFAEGPKLCLEAAKSCRCAALYATRRALEHTPALAALDAVTIPVSDPVADKLSSTKSSQGVFGLFALPAPDPAALDAARRILALERVQDPGNVGTLIRSAAAFGFDAVLLGPGCAAPYAPRTLRASMGAAVRMPVFETGDLPAALRALGDRGVTCLAAALQNAGVAGTDTETGAASGSAAPENAASGSAAPASGSQALSNGGAAAAGGNAPGA